jgi:2-dehydropantoate 2-reductase
MTIRPIDGQRRGGGSTWQSLERGLSSIETDYMNGEIALIARLHGLAAPVNELLQRLTAQAARIGTPAGSVSPDEILKQLA